MRHPFALAPRIPITLRLHPNETLQYFALFLKVEMPFLNFLNSITSVVSNPRESIPCQGVYRAEKITEIQDFCDEL